MTIQQQIFALQDKPYGEFQSRLLPTIAKERIIGVRIPVMRKLAKQLTKEEPEAVQAFLEELPHTYYDEDILHAILISEIKDYDRCIRETERFLPYIDNWAVCDIMSPKVFKRHRSELIEKIRGWSASEHTYTCRFGMEMLMSFYLDEDFRAGVSGDSGAGAVGGILCKYDDCLVFCYGTCQTVGCCISLYSGRQTFRLGA